MIICRNCGNGNDDDAKFCRSCGTGLAAAEAHHTAPQATATVTMAEGGSTSLSPNIARMLCYIAGWISGIVFLIVEKKDMSVRFHAWQSILTFGILTLLAILFNVFFLPGALWSMWWFFRWLFWLIIYIGGLVLWIVFIVKALQGQDYHLPVIGSIAHSITYRGQTEQTPVSASQAPAQSRSDAPSQKPVSASAMPKPAELPSQKKGSSGDFKYCISCGEVLPKKAVFCSRCGEKQA